MLKNEIRSAIHLLPTESQLILVQTQPVLTITALIPKTVRTVYADYWKGSISSPNVVQFELETPDLLWSQIFIHWRTQHIPDWANCRCYGCSFKESLLQTQRSYDTEYNYYRYFVHQIKKETSNDQYVDAAPYSLANIDNGYVCWGGINFPCSLRKAHSDYWQSVHNNSPGKYPIDVYNPLAGNLTQQLVTFMKAYKPLDADWADKRSIILGEKFVTSTEGPDGVYVSTDDVTHLPQQRTIGFAFAQGDSWKIKTSEKEFEIESSKVIVR